MKMLNLGCGSRFHPDWINLDFKSTGKDVIGHNLLKGVPFESESFEVVYHSHVLEHFTRKDASSFIEECFRVLKKNGVIRIVVPDLERIAKDYLDSLEKAISNNDSASKHNYEWMKLEMYDQTVRNHSGGEMASYLQRDVVPNLDFVYHRVGQEAKNIHEEFKNKKKVKPSKLASIYRVFVKCLNQIKPFRTYSIGRFRQGGEIHQWMYDRYSLQQLLLSCGFEDIEIQTGNTSKIKQWDQYKSLDLDESGILRKPDSLIIEAVKK